MMDSQAGRAIGVTGMENSMVRSTKEQRAIWTSTAFEALACSAGSEASSPRLQVNIWRYFKGLLLCDKEHCYIENPGADEGAKPMPKQPGRFIACFVKAAQPDYKGTIQGGRAIVFEAKHTEGSKIDRSRLTAEQMRCLEKHSKLGAHAFVIVSFGLRRFFRIPWPVWRDMKKLYGRQYLKQEEIAKYKIPAPGGVIKLLDGVLDGGD